MHVHVTSYVRKPLFVYTVLFISSVNLSLNLLSPGAIYEHSTLELSTRIEIPFIAWHES